MTTLLELLDGATNCATIALDQTATEPMLAAEDYAQVRVTARDVTVDGQVDPSKPRARVLSRGFSIYAALGWKLQNVEWYGEGFGDGDPSVGSLLQMVGGSEWKVLDSEFHDSRAFGQFAVGDDNGVVPTDWEVGRCAFLDNGSPSGPGVGHTSEQEHMVYVVSGNPRDEMRGNLHDLYFVNNYNGATVKLGGVDAWNGSCLGVTGERFTFSGHHDTPLLFPGKVEVDVTGVELASDADVGDITIWCNGAVTAHLHDVGLPGNFFQTCWPGYPQYETWWSRLLRCSPRVLPVGTDSSQRRGEITFD